MKELEDERDLRINNIWVRWDENETISCKVNNPPKIKDPHSPCPSCFCYWLSFITEMKHFLFLRLLSTNFNHKSSLPH